MAKRATEFNVGDKVKWTSQSSGYWKEKAGIVEQVVKPNTSPRIAKGRKFSSGYGPGMGRPKPSYLINVDGTLYWPRTCHLRLVRRARR